MPYVLEIRGPADFNTDVAKLKLISLNLTDDDGPRVNFVTPGDVFGVGVDDREGVDRQEQLLRFAGYVDLENGTSVSPDS